RRDAAGIAPAVGVEVPPRLAAQVVLHVVHAGQVLDDPFGAMLGLAALHCAGERHLAAGHRDGDLAGGEPAVGGQPLMDLVADPLVRALVALGPQAARAAIGLVPPFVLAIVHVATHVAGDVVVPVGDPLAGAAART